MRKKLLYRLGEYRITDYENGRLSWERHVDFGVQRSGDGYILGDTLILGPASHEENGFLIGEFLDRLKKIPVWEKTRYYCHASELLEVATGRELTEDFLTRIPSSGKRTPTALKPGMFRLGRYRITLSAGHEVFWQTPGGVHRVAGGPGRIESGLLILGPQEVDEEGPKKRDFLEMLKESASVGWNPSLVPGIRVAGMPGAPTTGQVKKAVERPNCQGQAGQGKKARYHPTKQAPRIP